MWSPFHEQKIPTPTRVNCQVHLGELSRPTARFLAGNSLACSQTLALHFPGEESKRLLIGGRILVPARHQKINY